MSIPVSLLLGAVFGAVNVGAALWIVRRASALGPTRGMQLVLAGMVARMSVALAAVALVLVFVPVHRAAFVGGLGVLFVLGLAAEVLFVLGRAPGSPRPSADA